MRCFPAVATAWLLVALPLSAGCARPPIDPLPSWNEGPAKQALTEFVSGATKPGSPRFIPEAERIAVFDNDGTLWSEQPHYFQLAFILDRIKARSSSCSRSPTAA